MHKAKFESITAYKKAIQELIPNGYPTIDNTAQRFGMAVRTLQRRMQEAGMTYSNLVDQVRYDEACRLLKNSQKSITAISKNLGFADPSNFSRAFQRWSGISPKTYRCMTSAQKKNT